jgi:phage FluMu protein Com
MPIEFRCSQCNKLLRTADDTAGKKAKCPECGTVMTIPEAPAAAAAAAAGGSPFGAAPPPPSFPPDTGNPYQSPGQYEPSGPGEYQPPVSKGTLDFNDIFSRTWTIFKQQWGMCVGVFVLFAVIRFVFNIVVGQGSQFVGVAARDKAVLIAVTLLANIVTIVFAAWLQVGLTKCFLKMAKGKTVEIGELFTGATHLLPILAASILFGIIVLLGFVALIVPGIILSLMFSQYYYLIIDRNASIIDSLKMSMDLTDGNKLMLFAIGLVAGIVGTLVTLLTCCLGGLVVGPYLTLMNAVIYYTLIGQPTAEQRQYGQDTPFGSLPRMGPVQ